MLVRKCTDLARVSGMLGRHTVAVVEAGPRTGAHVIVEDWPAGTPGLVDWTPEDQFGRLRVACEECDAETTNPHDITLREGHRVCAACATAPRCPRCPWGAQSAPDPECAGYCEDCASEHLASHNPHAVPSALVAALEAANIKTEDPGDYNAACWYRLVPGGTAQDPAMVGAEAEARRARTHHTTPRYWAHLGSDTLETDDADAIVAWVRARMDSSTRTGGAA